MRGPLFWLSTLVFFAGPALSAPDDPWTIDGDNVNLRRGPGTGHEIKRQLNRDQRVIERGREGEWRQVEVVGAEGLLGWVHHSLLTPGDRTVVSPPVAPATVPDPAPKTPVSVRSAFKSLHRAEFGYDRRSDDIDYEEISRIHF